MNTIASGPASRFFFSAFGTLAVFLLLALPTCWSHAAKDTPFGIELTSAHFPATSSATVVNALALSAEIGSHSSFVWQWGDASGLRDAVAALPPLMRQFGLKSFIQLRASTFAGNPAPPPGYVRSFGNQLARDRYLSDVAVLALAKPDYIVLATEANFMYLFNRLEFEYFRSLYTSAYYLIKTISPGTQVGASFQYEVWFQDYVFNHVDVPSMLAPSDLIAFTTYPESLVHEGHYASIAEIPPEFYGAGRWAYPNARIVFSEVGWASKGRSTPQLQAEFVRNLPRILSHTNPELVTWAMLHDVDVFQSYFEHFNSMGLLNLFGNPKPALQAARELVFPRP